MRSMRSAQRQVELRRLSNQLPVLGKANSLCEVGNISLQPGTSMMLKLCINFVIQDHHLIVPCIHLFVKCCVFCLFVKLRLSPGHGGLGIKISRVIVARANSV